MFNENFLHFVWRLQYFDKKKLLTTEGEEITIFFPGILNHNAGPDFTNARIRIGEIEWFGNIEIHIKSSDWRNHKHSSDESYNNIILHVTYTDNEPVRRENGCLIPCIELKDRIDKDMILRQSTLQESISDIPCFPQLNHISAIHKIGMIERMVSERLMQKQEHVFQLLKRNNGDWHETNYQLLASNFGFKINADPFLRLAKSLPIKVLLKYSNKLQQIEALLFGMAGFLDETVEDEYHKSLCKEFQFLSHKHHLSLDKLSLFEWKFLRIRPANFPTVRISQLASLIHVAPEVFTAFTEFESLEEVYKKFSMIQPSAYWQKHHYFGQSDSDVSTRKLGKGSVDNIIINTIVLAYFSMGKLKDMELFVERALGFLEMMKGEENSIIKKWIGSDMPLKTAFDTQGIIQLYNQYCNKRSCLQCEIGAGIIRSGKTEQKVFNKI